MPDYGSKIADKAIDQTARKIRGVYKDAWFDIRKKMDDFTKRHIQKNAEMMKKLEAGEITKAEYDSWMRGQVFMGKQWDMKLDQIAKIMDNANKEAVGVVRNGSFNVFAENYNHTAYELEKRIGGSVSFNLYNEESVARLLKKNPKMLPEWKINERKDYAWNRQKVENAITQGIIQGEGIDKITDRLTDALITTNENRMRTFARTGITGAQNAGRLKQMKDAEEEGIKVKKRWLATLDDRTRDTHQELDGQEVPVDKPFEVDGMEIMYPGDPNADPSLVYNCRCTMIEVYEGIDRKSVRRDEDDNEVAGMTYKEWKEAKENGTLNTEKKIDLITTQKQQNNLGEMNSPLIEKREGHFVITSSEDGNISINTDGVLENTVEKMEFGGIFNESQAISAAETMEQLQEEYPLDRPLSYVGDIRVERGLPTDMEILDIQDEYPQFSGFSAKYVPTEDGRRKIWIVDQSLNTEKLVNEFDMRHTLREKYMDSNGMLSLQNAFETTSDTIEGTLDHEYCHALQDMYLNAFGSSNNALTNCFNELNTYLEENKEKVLQISKYATVHPFEMLSESFVQMRDINHPDTIATKTAKEVWKIFEKYMTGGGRRK